MVRSIVPAAVGTDAAELYMFLVPKTDYTIIDTWFVMGMSATGSKDFQLKGEVFVPEHRGLRHKDLVDGTGPGSEFNGGALYRLPRMATVPFSLAAPLIGIAEPGAADLYTGHAGTAVRRPQSGPGRRNSHACCQLGR